MSKGDELERHTLAFLENVFKQLNLPVSVGRRQTAGTQYGFDIAISFFDEKGKGRHFYVECKNYTNAISWNDINVKLTELHGSNYRADGYIAISPFTNFSNINANSIEKFSRTIQAPIRYWTPEAMISKYAALDDTFFQYLYGQKPTETPAEKQTIRDTLSMVIQDMLGEKDELVAKAYAPSFPKELTLAIPRIGLDDIVGRSEELETLHKLLFAHKSVVVKGMGGIGKTTLARGYLSKYYDDYQHIVWINQSTGNLVSNFVSEKGLINNLNIASETMGSEDLLYEVLRQLKNIPSGPNLMVLDNSDRELIEVRNLLPGPPNWHVLVTSREEVEGFFTEELEFLSPDEAFALFRKHCKLVKGDDVVRELLNIVDYHTLTIEILAKTAEYRRVSIEELKTSIEKDLEARIHISHNQNKKVDRVRSYLSFIFDLSKLAVDAVWVMKQLCCLPSEFHSYGFLEKLINPKESNKQNTFAETLNELVKHGWILYNRKTDSYKMHRVVNDIASGQLSIVLEDIDILLENVIAALAIDYTKDNPVEKFPWIPYGQAILVLFSNDISVEIGRLQNNLALILRALGQYQDARLFLEKALTSAEKNFSLGHSIIATRYFNLASVLKDLGQYEDARRYLENALASFKENFGLEHPIIAACYSDLGLVLKELGQYEDARKCLEMALASDEKKFGLEHARIAIRYSNLALILQDLGQYDEARQYLEKVVVSREKNFGPEHPTTAIGYSNLAMILKDLGQYDDARKYLERALVSDENNFGSDHPAVVIHHSNLGLVLVDLGQYDDARKYLEKALASAEKNFGPDHPKTAIRYSNLALVLNALGEYEDARKYFTKALMLAEKSFGPEHPTIAKRYSSLGVVLRNLGQFDEAREFLKKALALDEKNFGPEHPTTALRYWNLASVQKDASALPLAEKALAIFKKVLPAGHLYIMKTKTMVRDIEERLAKK